MLKTLPKPVRLLEIEEGKAFADACAQPVKQEDRAFYLTDVPDYIRAFARAGLPCIYLEKAAGEKTPDLVYGADIAVPFDVCADALADAGFLEDLWRRHYHLPWEIARTGRLLIRESVMEDLPQLLAICEEERGNADVQPFSEEPEKELQAYLENRYPFYGYGLWSLVEEKSGAVIGRAGLEETKDGVPELAYLLAKDKRGQGFAKEAAKAILAYAKEKLGFSRVALLTSKANAVSQRLALSLGFLEIRQKEEAKRKYFEIDLTSL